MSQASSPHVAIALLISSFSGSEKLNGIFDYLSDGHCWSISIYRTKDDFTAQAVQREIASGASGFIVGIPGADEALAVLAKSDLPVVLTNIEPGPLAGRPRVITVRNDAEAIGREAAQTLLKQGVYKCFGFVGHPANIDWSVRRGRAFRDALAEAGFVGRMFDFTHFPNRTTDRGELLDWLRQLPKPCGILAACDDRAYEVLDVCRQAKIAVPGEVGVLGIDNDALICEHAEPSLSSVQPDWHREGALAAELLDREMRRNGSTSAKESLHLVGISQTVLRGSTVPLSDYGKLVQKAVAYIQKNAARQISVVDVARHLKVSRPLLDLRFRQVLNKTVHDTIIACRLEEVKRRLVSTSDRIEKIATDCGWSYANSLRDAFKRHYGFTMTSCRGG